MKQFQVGSMKVFAQNNAKFYFGMGSLESEARMKGANNAQTKLKTAGIIFDYYKIPEAGHEPLLLEKFKEALNFVMQ